MAGVVPTGFDRKTLQEIKADAEERQRDELGQELNQRADSLLGQLNGVMFDALAQLWEVLEALYSSFNPDAATGQSLDNLSALTGTTRRDATFSEVLTTVNIDGSFTLPAGSVATVAGNANARFLLVADVVNAGGGPANFTDVLFRAETAGPVVANAGTLTEGPSLVTGWNTVTNPLDADQGLALETDSELRLKREQEIAGIGGSTVDGIRADVLAVDGVTSASVLENQTNAVDANGLPAHSFEVVVLGGVDADIAQAIFGSKPAGILAFGATTVAVTDSEGDSVDISFTRPTTKDVWLEYDLAVDGSYAGDAQVKAAVVAFAEDAFGQGADVVQSRLVAPAFGVIGVRDVTAVRLGFSVSPTLEDNLVIAVREIAAFDTSRVAVATVVFVDS